MTRARSTLALVAALTLALGACGGDDDEATGGEDPTEEVGSEATPFEAPDGAAATVGGTEVAADDVEALYDQLASAPEVSTQLEGEEGAELATLLRSQILSQLIVKEIVVASASEDFGIEVTTEDVEARLDQLAEEAGGDEELDAQLATAGIDRSLLVDLELPLSLTLEQVQARLAETAGEPETPAAEPAPEGEEPALAEPTPAEQALQTWGIEQFEAADVSVADAYGTWNPQSGQVEPGAA